MTMQCKDIEDGPLVRFIAEKQAELGMWVCVWNLEPPYSDLPGKLFRAKTGKLIAKGYLDGCNCGCRGDYEVTDKGRARFCPDVKNPYNEECAQ